MKLGRNVNTNVKVKLFLFMQGRHIERVEVWLRSFLTWWGRAVSFTLRLL
jgi:hypothetical protein